MLVAVSALIAAAITFPADLRPGAATASPDRSLLLVRIDAIDARPSSSAMASSGSW